MTKEELERLYMDIYDNGIPKYDYKEKFKRYVNNRFERIEKENEELRIQKTNAILKGLEMQVAKDSHRDRANKTHEQLVKAKELIKTLKDDLSMYSGAYQKEIAEAERFLSEVDK